jgi:hypothetical protein
MRDGRHTPILVYDRATAIHAHLLEWAEGDPAEWFKLYLAELPDQPGEPPGSLLALHPNLNKAVARFKQGFPPGVLDGVGIQVISAPLYFVGLGWSFHHLRNQLGTQSCLGLLDTAKFDPQRPGDVDPEAIRLLGPLAVGDVAELGGIDELLRAAAQFHL